MGRDMARDKQSRADRSQPEIGDGSTDHIFPAGWPEVFESLDLERAYDGLAGYEDYHTYTLRGFLRHLQLRSEDALAHFDEAEARFPGFRTEDDVRRYWILLNRRFTACMLNEQRNPDAQARILTDTAIQQMEDSECPQCGFTEKLVSVGSGFHRLLRGDYAEARSILKGVIESTRSSPSTAAYIGAAAAAHELDLDLEARVFYENSELCMAFSTDRWRYVIHITWLAALCSHWGWEGERTRWYETTRVLDCPEATRAVLLERARLLVSACRTHKALAFA